MARGFDCLSYTISFFGLNRYALQNFFQNFFQAPQTALNGDPHDFLMDTFCPGNIFFGHAENEMGVNTFRLFVRQPGNGGMKFLHSHFALIQLMRRKCNEKSLMLNTVVPVKGVVCLVPVCTQTVSRFFVVELGKQIDQKAIEKAKFLATQAREQEVFYQHKEIGYNYRMSNVTAGIGRGQLHYLDENISLKRNIYETYEDAFKDIPEITMNPIPEDCEANYWLSAMTLSKDSKVMPMDIINALGDANIESRPIWKPMHMQPVYENCDFITAKEDGTSVAEDIFNRGLCLPSDIKNTRADMERIIKVVRGLFQK